MPDTTAAISAITGAGYINLRGDAADGEFVQRVRKVLGQDLPLEANTTSSGRCTCYWLGPDEWLLRVDATELAETIANLESQLEGLHVAASDLSGGLVGFRLARRDARQLLARGCTLDLHEAAFQAGACAQSGFGKANVLIHLADAAPSFDIFVRRSFADYLNRWMASISGEPSIEFP